MNKLIERKRILIYFRTYKTKLRVLKNTYSKLYSNGDSIIWVKEKRTIICRTRKIILYADL